MVDITAANAVLTLVVPGLFPSGVQLQQFAADDVYDLDEIDSVETVMGVDGVLSGGWTWKPQPQSIMLMANSPSNQVFDTINAQQKAGNTTYPMSGVLILPAIGLKFIQTNGFLTGYKLPGAKKLIGSRRFRITWNDVSPARA